MRIKDAMEVEDAEGNRLAMVKKALVSPIRHRWTVEVAGGPGLELQGNIPTTSTPSLMGVTPWPPSRRSGSGVADNLRGRGRARSESRGDPRRNGRADVITHEGR